MKSILFACIENSCRSQIAEGWARRLAKGSVEVYSAGSRPGKHVNPQAMAMMKKQGVDISSHYPKGFEALPRKKFDCVVTMGCGEECPVVAGEKRLDWQIPDPKGKDEAFFAQVGEDLKNKVRDLLPSLDVSLEQEIR